MGGGRGGLRSHRDTHLSLHHPPQVEDDASDDVDLRHGVGSVLVPVCREAILSGVAWGQTESRRPITEEEEEEVEEEEEEDSPFSLCTHAHTNISTHTRV